MRQRSRPIFAPLLGGLQMAAGLFLLGCAVLNVIALVARQSSATVTITSMGKTTTLTYDTQAEMEKQAPGYTPFLYGSAAAGLLLHLAMIAGGIGLILLRAWAWWLSVAWALLQLIYQVVNLAYLWVVAMPAANRVVTTVPHDDKGVCGQLVNTNTFYHVFWLLFAFGLTFYGLLILVLLFLPPVTQAVRRKEPEGREEEEPDEDRRGRRREEDY